MIRFAIAVLIVLVNMSMPAYADPITQAVLYVAAISANAAAAAGLPAAFVGALEIGLTLALPLGLGVGLSRREPPRIGKPDEEET